MFKVRKVTNKNFDLFRVSKMTTKNFDSFKVSKMTIKKFNMLKVSKITRVRSRHLKKQSFKKSVLAKITLLLRPLKLLLYKKKILYNI